MSRLHKEIDGLRLHAERKCRKFMTPAAPFGPEVKYWYNRIHALKSMKRMLLNPDAKYNRSHNFCFAGHLMENPKSYSLAQIIDGLRFCRIQQKEARKRAVPSRDKMMRERLALAVEKRDRKKIAGIKQILNTENSKRNWSVVNATLDGPRSPPLTSIVREEGGS